MGIFDDIKRVDLGTYLSTHYGCKIENAGKDRRVNPCPLCDHKDCCTLLKAKGYQKFRCYSEACEEFGDVVDIVSKKEHISAKKAAEKIKREEGL